MKVAESEVRADALFMDWRAWELLKQCGQRHTEAGALMREHVRRAVHQIGPTAVGVQLEDVVGHLRALPYSEYLRTIEWRQTRFFALLRARWRCRMCNARGPLQVHHRTYERLGCEPLSDLVALCDDCHSGHHDRQGK